jgi:soluble lytic murein transglycosylase-like protein
MKSRINATLTLLAISIAAVAIPTYLVVHLWTFDATVKSSLPNKPLQEFVEEAIAASKPELSAVRIKVIKSILVTIAQDVFETREQMEYWISLIGIESRYNGKIKSPAGAIGLGQLLPKYKDDFGKSCGMSPVNREDIDDDFTNAYLSACYFNQLIKLHNGNIPLALSSYNAGQSSVTTTNAKTGGKMAAETETYIRKVWIKTEQVNNNLKEIK